MARRRQALRGLLHRSRRVQAGERHPRAGEDAHELEDLAQGVVDALRKPIEVDGLALSIGASVGYAVARQADTASAVVAAADAALYDAKRAGRGTWRASAFTHSPHPA